MSQIPLSMLADLSPDEQSKLQKDATGDALFDLLDSYKGKNISAKKMKQLAQEAKSRASGQVERKVRDARNVRAEFDEMLKLASSASPEEIALRFVERLRPYDKELIEMLKTELTLKQTSLDWRPDQSMPEDSY